MLVWNSKTTARQQLTRSKPMGMRPSICHEMGRSYAIKDFSTLRPKGQANSIVDAGSSSTIVKANEYDLVEKTRLLWRSLVPWQRRETGRGISSTLFVGLV